MEIPNHIYEIEFNQDMIDIAYQRSQEINKSLNNSITKDKGRTAGFLGEEAFKNYSGAIPTEGRDIYSSDCTKDSEKLEIKTKRSLYRPRLDFSQSVNINSKHQEPDKYVFIHMQFAKRKKAEDGNWIYYQPIKIFIDGYKTYKDFWEKAYILDVGESDGNNNYQSKSKQYNMLIQDLDLR